MKILIFWTLMGTPLLSSAQMDTSPVRTPLQVIAKFNAKNQLLFIDPKGEILWQSPSLAKSAQPQIGTTHLEDINLALSQSRLILFKTFEDELAIGTAKGDFLKFGELQTKEALDSLWIQVQKSLQGHLEFQRLRARRQRITFLRRQLKHCTRSRRPAAHSPPAPTLENYPQLLFENYRQTEARLNLNLSNCRNHRSFSQVES